MNDKSKIAASDAEQINAIIAKHFGDDADGAQCAYGAVIEIVSRLRAPVTVTADMVRSARDAYEKAKYPDHDAVMSAVIQAGQSAGIIGGDVKSVSGAECMCILDYLSRAPVAGEAVANMFWDADFPNEVHESLKDAMYAAQSNHGLLQDDLADIQCAIRLPALRVLVTEGDEDGDVFEYKVIEGQEACQPRTASAPGTDDQPTKEQAVPTVSEAAYNTGFGDGLEVAAVVVNNLRSDGLSTDLPSIVVALRALKNQHAAHASAPIVMLARDDGHGVIRAFDAA